MKARLLVGIFLTQFFTVYAQAHLALAHLKNERRVHDVKCSIKYTVEEQYDDENKYKTKNKTYNMEGKDKKTVPVVIKDSVHPGDDYEYWQEVTDFSEYTWPGDFHVPGPHAHDTYLSSLCITNGNIALEKLLKNKIDVATSEVTLCVKYGPKEKVSCKCVGFTFGPYVQYTNHSWPSNFDFDSLIAPSSVDICISCSLPMVGGGL